MPGSLTMRPSTLDDEEFATNVFRCVNRGKSWRSCNLDATQYGRIQRVPKVIR